MTHCRHGIDHSTIIAAAMESRRARPDLSALDHPEVDVRALQAEVRAAAARMRGSTVPAQPTAQEPSPTAAPRLHALHRTAEISPYQPLSDANPITVAIKRAVRRALRWYLWPLTTHMSSHNRALADAVAEHRRQLTRLRLEVERVGRDAAPAGDR
jgi:hypothetical protein